MLHESIVVQLHPPPPVLILKEERRPKKCWPSHQCNNMSWHTAMQARPLWRGTKKYKSDPVRMHTGGLHVSISMCTHSVGLQDPQTWAAGEGTLKVYLLVSISGLVCLEQTLLQCCLTPPPPLLVISISTLGVLSTILKVYCFLIKHLHWSLLTFPKDWCFCSWNMITVLSIL